MRLGRECGEVSGQHPTWGADGQGKPELQISGCREAARSRFWEPVAMPSAAPDDRKARMPAKQKPLWESPLGPLRPLGHQLRWLRQESETP